MRKIAILNQKGGSGKTTTAVNLSACLAAMNRMVLLVDMDPQSHSTVHLGIKPHELDVSVYDVLINSTPVDRATKKTSIENLWILPANINLSGAEIELVSIIGRENVLNESLNKIRTSYDYIIVDCPPSLGLLTINALTAVKEIIIPVQAEFFALEGMAKLMETIEIVKKRINSDLEIAGVLITFYDSRKNICKDVEKNIKDFFKDKVFKTKIRDNVKLAEAPSYGVPIIKYDPKCHGAIDYKNFAREVIEMEGKR